MKNENNKHDLKEVVKQEKLIEEREKICKNCGSIIQPELDICPSCKVPTIAGFTEADNPIAGSFIIDPIAIPGMPTIEDEHESAKNTLEEDNKKKKNAKID